MNKLTDEARTHIHQTKMPWAHTLLLIVSVLWTLFGIDMSGVTWSNNSYVALLALLTTYFFFSMEIIFVGIDLYIMNARYVLKSFFRNICLRSCIYIGFTIICGCMFTQTGQLLLLILGVAASSGLKFEEIWAQNNIDRYISQKKKGIQERIHRPKRIR